MIVLIIAFVVWLLGTFVAAGVIEEWDIDPNVGVYACVFWPICPLYFLGKWAARRWEQS
jgi:hypothetical protein